MIYKTIDCVGKVRLFIASHNEASVLSHSEIIWFITNKEKWFSSIMHN